MVVQLSTRFYVVAKVILALAQKLIIKDLIFSSSRSPST